MALQAPKCQLPRLQERGQAQVPLGVAGVIFLLSQPVEKRKKRGKRNPVFDRNEEWNWLLTDTDHPAPCHMVET